MSFIEALSIFFVAGFVGTLGVVSALGLLHWVAQDEAKKVYWTLLDKETGVRYLITKEGGITPMLNADGSLCCERDKGDE